MFNKLSIKQLLGLFAVLLVIVLAVRFFDNKNDNNRSFKSDLVSFENEDVATIKVWQRANPQIPYTFFRDGESWGLEYNENMYNASEDVIQNMFTTLKNLKPERVAANKSEKWNEYQVSDSTGTKILLEDNNGKEIACLYAGKFTYTQPKGQPQSPYQRQQGKMTSFVRLEDDKEVYAVDGYVSMAFDRNLQYLRASEIISSSYLNWNKVTVNHPADSSFVLEKKNNKWFLNGALADSVSVVNYLSNIQRLNSTNFYDDPVNVQPVHSILIEGSSFERPVEIKGYYQDAKNIISSSENKNTYFTSGEDEIFRKLFQQRPKAN